MSLRLTSLLRVEERLVESEHFVKRIGRERGDALGYDLNAFLSAARSVTFLLQKEFSKLDGFAAWWTRERTLLASDPAARFFLDLRNYSQKEGPVSLVGIGLRTRPGSRRWRWSFRFAGTANAVPSVLLNRDVVDCCREHLAKLARVVLSFSDRFPFDSCPARALTPEGAEALNIDLDDVDAAFGFPRGWSRVAARPERIRYLAEHVRADAVDFATIRRISRLRARRPAAADDPFGERLATSMVSALEQRAGRTDEGHTLRDFLATENLRTSKGTN